MKAFLEAIGWPHASIVLGLVFMVVFRRQLGQFIGRVTSVSKGGIKAEALPEAQREDKSEAVQELLSAIGDSIVLRDVESRIRTELQEKELRLEGETVKVLLRFLAASRILLEFEQIYNMIFGSQIFLLKKLNEAKGLGLPNETIIAHFAHVQQTFKEFGSWTLQQYLTFLRVRALIVVAEETYHITNFGVEFLTWMTRNGRSDWRPL